MKMTKREIIEIQTAGFRKGQGVLVEILPEMNAAAEKFAAAYCDRHAGELWRDSRKMKDRAKCGILGEMAVCEALGYGWAAADTSIGDWKKYQTQDLKHLGINAGVKTSRLGNLPLLYVNSSETQVICVLGEKGYVWVSGVATPAIIKRGCDDRYVKDKNILAENRRKGCHKSAFVKFEKLKNLDILYIRSGGGRPSK